LIQHDNLSTTIQPTIHSPNQQTSEPNRCRRTDQAAKPNRKHGKRMAHVLIRYMAPPSAHGDLIDSWNKALDGTKQCVVLVVFCFGGWVEGGAEGMY